MNLTLLLDLDNTLLGNDMGTFLPVYLKRLGKKFPNIPGEEFNRKLMAATQAMVVNQEPGLTLEQAFDKVFYPSLGVEKENWIDILVEFYANDFGQLSYLTQQRQEAIHLVDQALRAGYDVVIATNPIFPQTAIRHRLNWAGINDLSPLRLITSFEKFHFAKPNPAYYAEILAQLGRPEQPALMVGNSLEDDLLPAAVIGIPGYLVTDHPVALPQNTNGMIHQGPLNCVWAWANQIASHQSHPPIMNSPQGILASLKSTAAALDTICISLNSSEWLHKPSNQDWAVTEIVCHLRDVDKEVNLPRLNAIQAEEAPFIAGIETDPWAEERHYIQESGPLALKEFITARSAITTLLSQLTTSDWDRTARHAIFGPTSILELLGFVVTHDNVHIRQVYQTLESASYLK
jgi:FMN phosphatase YigB (HAD superfamily)